LVEWLYEDGIGEARAALIADGRIIEARIERDGAGPLVGTIAEAKIVETIVPRLSARVALSGGGEAMLDGIPPRLDEGRAFLIQIVRELNSPRRFLPRPAPRLSPVQICAIGSQRHHIQSASC
jgi:ribonuclease G